MRQKGIKWNEKKTRLLGGKKWKTKIQPYARMRYAHGDVESRGRNEIRGQRNVHSTYMYYVRMHLQ